MPSLPVRCSAIALVSKVRTSVISRYIFRSSCGSAGEVRQGPGGACPRHRETGVLDPEFGDGFQAWGPLARRGLYTPRRDAPPPAGRMIRPAVTLTLRAAEPRL